MAETMQVYKCEKCGNLVEILVAGTCAPVCCGVEMRLLAENSTDGAKEKHVPVLEKVPEGWRVTVGAVAHPMEEKHFIGFIELIADGFVHRAHLKPGDKPEILFRVQSVSATARAYCNLHGLWKSQA